MKQAPRGRRAIRVGRFLLRLSVALLVVLVLLLALASSAGRAPAAGRSWLCSSWAVPRSVSSPTCGSHRLPRYADGNWLAGPVYDLFASALFLLVAILLLVTGLSRPAAALAALGLAGITALGLWGYGSSDSSTASLSLLAPFLYGFPLVILVFVIDAAVRMVSARSTRQAREL